MNTHISNRGKRGNERGKRAELREKLFCLRQEIGLFLRLANESWRTEDDLQVINARLREMLIDESLMLRELAALGEPPYRDMAVLRE